MASRAQLLSGLRTGGPRGSSPCEDDDSAAGRAMLKANAAVFTPGQQAQQRLASTNELEARFAALQMQQAISAGAHGGSAGHQTHLASMYGASHGQPQHQHIEHSALHQQQQQQAHAQAQAEVDHLIRQKQAQLLQNQLLQQQQQQQQQQQHQQHQQLVAQQRMLLGQIQAEYEQHAWQQDQVSQQVFSASEQRQAAQASLQANLRQRQAAQLHAQLLQQQHHQQAQRHPGDFVAELHHQQVLLQRLQGLRQSQQQYGAGGVTNGALLDDVQSFVSAPSLRQSQRSGSPANNTGMSTNQQRRERQPSSTAADMAKSWRSTSTSATKANGHSTRSTPPPPSIVVDDSASDKSDDVGTNDSCASGDMTAETPETSEEDVGISLRKAEAHDEPMIMAPLAVRKRVASSNLSTPRVASLGVTPRNRAFASEGRTSSLADAVAGTSPSGGSHAGSATSSSSSVTPSIGGSSAPQPARQPRGPPTEFHAVNFAVRLSARTRRQAMSKLCASPRAASFNFAPRRSVPGATLTV